MPFPDLCYSSISYSVSPEIERTTYSTQNTRQRFLRKKRDDRYSVSVELDSSDLSLFESFVTTEIENGALSFSGPYYDGSERIGNLEIVDGVYDVSYSAPDWWRLSYSFDVKDRDMTDALNIYEIVNEYLGFNETYDAFNALENLVNNNELNA